MYVKSIFLFFSIFILECIGVARLQQSTVHDEIKYPNSLFFIIFYTFFFFLAVRKSTHTILYFLSLPPSPLPTLLFFPPPLFHQLKCFFRQNKTKAKAIQRDPPHFFLINSFIPLGNKVYEGFGTFSGILFNDNFTLNFGTCR